MTAPTTAFANAAADEAQIRELIVAWRDAIGRRDLAGVLANHTDDILMFDVPPPVQLSGPEAFAESWRLFYKHYPRGDSFDLTSLAITAGETVAFAHGIIRCGSPDKGFDVRLTLGLRKEAGAWRIAHEHHSVPAGD